MELKDHPRFANIRFFASRYKWLDISAIETCARMHLLTSELSTAFDAHFARHDLSRGRFFILMILMRAGDQNLTPAEIADSCEVSRATITGLLDTLQSAGFIEREASVEDRRAVRVQLTAAGRAHLEKMLPDHYTRITRLMQRLTLEDRATLNALLDKIADGIPAVRDT